MNSGSHPPSLSLSLTPSLRYLLAFSIGLVVSNLYLYQPILREIGTTIDLKESLWGLIIAIVQFGYLLGVVFLIPAGDLINKKKLILVNLGVLLSGLIMGYFSHSDWQFILASFAIGLGSSTVQIIIPYSASLVSDSERGKLIGFLMSGLMFGIMLSRPAASLLTDFFGWKSVFVASGGALLVLITLLKRSLPDSPPSPQAKNYPQLLVSMFGLFKEHVVIGQRGFIQASLFGTFCLFWTAVPLHLEKVYGLNQSQIAVFALIGISGALIAPWAGKWADQGYTTKMTTYALMIASLCYVVEPLQPLSGFIGVFILCVLGIILDACVTLNLVASQKIIFSLPREKHSRANGIFIAIIFLGGGLGSFLGAFTYNKINWETTRFCGFLLPLIPLILHLRINKKAKKNLAS